jgi:spore maturation protein CgeB
MKIVMFYHSLVSDWNHGNAHFLRGVVSELIADGHEVEVFEPSDSWSRTSLIEHHGSGPLARFSDAYPDLKTNYYDVAHFHPETVVADADLVIVHEWNSTELVARVGRLRRRYPFVLLFHDTHHRMVTDPESMQRYDLRQYDGVLAFGKVLRDLYLSRGLAHRAWVWHEAADTRRFKPQPEAAKDGDLVWIGNWGDDERSAELEEFLINPVRQLGLKAAVYGVRYPDSARNALSSAGIDYLGWLPNFEVPDVFARYHLTVHVPRRPYVQALPGIPTIRPFEALACGIPLLCAPWSDTEGLFTPGEDLIFAESGAEMKLKLRDLMGDEKARASLAENGLRTITGLHTCTHRVAELYKIYDDIRSRQEAGEPELTLAK